MLKSKTRLLAIIFLVLMLLSSATFATEEIPISPVTSTHVHDDGTVHEGETHNDDESYVENIPNTDIDKYSMEIQDGPEYLYESNVVLNKHIDGNAFIMGNTVTINGDINGDLYVMGNTVRVNGDIYGNVFCIAQDFELSSMVYCDMYVCSVKVFIADIAQVRRDINTTAQSITLNSEIGRNANLSVQTVKFGENSRIYGNLKYTANKELTIPEGAVDGNIEFFKQKEYKKEYTAASIVSSYIWNFVITIVCTAAIWVFMLLVTPKFIKKSRSLVKNKFWFALGLGFGALVLTPFIALILLITIIGASLSLGLLALYTIGWLAAGTVVATAITEYAVNECKLKSFHKNFWYVLAVSAILWILRQIPFIGWWISFFVLVIGMGLVIVGIFSKEKTEEIK